MIKLPLGMVTEVKSLLSWVSITTAPMVVVPISIPIVFICMPSLIFRFMSVSMDNFHFILLRSFVNDFPVFPCFSAALLIE